MSTRASEPPGSEITPESLYRGRREFIKNAGLTLGTAAVVGSGLLWLVGNAPPPDAPPEESAAPGAQAQAQAPDPVAAQPIVPASSGPYTVDEQLTSFKDVSGKLGKDEPGSELRPGDDAKRTAVAS